MLRILVFVAENRLNSCVNSCLATHVIVDRLVVEPLCALKITTAYEIAAILEKSAAKQCHLDPDPESCYSSAFLAVTGPKRLIEYAEDVTSQFHKNDLRHHLFANDMQALASAWSTIVQCSNQHSSLDIVVRQILQLDASVRLT